MFDDAHTGLRDPYLILGATEDADDAAIEAAYLAGLKRWPPERDAARFNALREAYEQLRTRRQRLAQQQFDFTPPTLEDILERAGPVGPPRRPDRDLFAALLRGDG